MNWMVCASNFQSNFRQQLCQTLNMQRAHIVLILYFASAMINTNTLKKKPTKKRAHSQGLQRNTLD
jgi:hypothetical protein